VKNHALPPIATRLPTFIDTPKPVVREEPTRYIATHDPLYEGQEKERKKHKKKKRKKHKKKTDDIEPV